MATDPLVARYNNTLGLSCHGHDDAEALHHHHDALSIFEWNKCNALLFEKHDLYRDYALEMAITLSHIGDVMRRLNDFVGAARAYKECLDLFLEGLIDNGMMLKTRLNEIERQQGIGGESSYAAISYGALMDDVDFVTVGKTLHEHADYARIVAGVNTLLREIQCAKFVSHSASSRRRRRMSKLRATEENLKKAVESLSMETTPIEKLPLTSQAKPSLKRSVSTPGISRERPSVIRRSFTSIGDGLEKYDGISTRIAPIEEALVIALKRFPAPKTVPDDPSYSNAQDATQAAGIIQFKTPPIQSPANNDAHSPRSVERVDSGFESGFDVPTCVHVKISTFI
mmetsp:Transcript_15778/g.25922  ORF Transcript_15778/g.25922 Transcript_15778/m.25922 type:complete len:341 (+) Transcript_15778:135-1157(+)